MGSEQAIRVAEALKITDFGIPANQSTWPRVSLSSNQMISISHSDSPSTSRESLRSTKETTTNNLVHILHASGKIISESRTVAESSKLHPIKPIIALQAQNIFQVYNFETKNLLSEAEIHNAYVCFWKWADNETIMLVTESSVCQWMVFKERSEPEVIFKRLPRLHMCEIVNCALDENHHWYTVTGLLEHPQNGGVEGITQVFSAVYKLTQCIEAHCTAFFTHKFPENPKSTNVMFAASRNLDSLNGKVHSIELGPCPHGNLAPRTHSNEIKYLEEHPIDDFPISIQADVNHSVVYIITKHGYLFLAELESAMILATIQISPQITFCSSLNPQSDLLVVNRAGQVHRVSVDWLYLIKYVRVVLNKPKVADRLQNCRGMEEVDLLLPC